MESKEILTDFIETQFVVFSKYFYRDSVDGNNLSTVYMGKSWNFGVLANLFLKTYKSTIPLSSLAPRDTLILI